MQVCPRPDCRRAGDDVGTCADKTLGCPRFREVNFSTYVVIRCASCNMTRAIPAGELMMASRNPFKCLGETERCKAVPLTRDPAASHEDKGSQVAPKKKA